MEKNRKTFGKAIWTLVTGRMLLGNRYVAFLD